MNTRNGIIRAGRRVQANQVVAATPNPVSHPLGAPTLSGNTISVDLMLNQPTRVTRMIMDLTLQRFIADRVFASAGGVSGGAVVYDQATANELYAKRDVERISPGMEFPEITGELPTPKVAEVEKWGGKIWISDEARDRNNSATFTRLMRQVGNTIVRKVNARAIAELEAAIADSGQTVTGRNWNAVVTAGTSASSAAQYPARDFALAQQMAQEDELGVVYDLWLLNPAQYAQLAIIYGDGLGMFLNSQNVSVYTSNRIAAGTAYACASQQVGEMRIEKPLATAAWREEGRERTWSQTGVRPVMYVTDPFSVLKFTGLAG